MQSDTRLKNYIDSRGSIFPNNYEEYDVHGGINSESCVFCFVEHDSWAFLYMTKNLPHLPRQLHELNELSTPKPTTVGCCPGCKETIDQHLSWNIPGLQHSKPAEIKEVIHNYILGGILPKNAFLHTKNQSKDEKCIFCKDALVHYLGEEMTIIEVPHDINSPLMGTARCCYECLEGIRELLLTQNPGQSFCPSSWDRCVECVNDYPITDAEFNSRQHKGTYGKHLCSTCIENTFDEKLGDDKFENVDCESCGDEMVYDWTLHANSIGIFGKFICNTCKTSVDIPEEIYKDYHHLSLVRQGPHGDYYAGAKEECEEYRALAVNISNGIVKILDTGDVHIEVANAIYEATFLVLGRLRSYGVQQTLYGDQ